MIKDNLSYQEPNFVYLKFIPLMDDLREITITDVIDTIKTRIAKVSNSGTV